MNPGAGERKNPPRVIAPNIAKLNTLIGGGAAISVVGSDGKLNLVPKHSTWTTPSEYPSRLQVGTDTRCIMDGTEISVSDSGLTTYSAMTKDAIVFSTGTKSIVIDENGITMTDTAGAGKSLAITFAALLAGKSVSLRADDYCDAGVDKSQQHLASAPYV